MRVNSHRSRIGLALYFAVGLVGCKVGPDYRKPETQSPANWSELPATTQPSPPQASTQTAAVCAPTTAPAMDLAQWWHIFHDPQLDALIERAISSNFDLQIADARIREARAQRAIVAGGQYPTIASAAAYTRQHPSQKGQLGRLNTGISKIFGADKVLGEYELYQAGFDASWEIDLFGGVRRAVEAADANAASMVEERRDLLVTLVAEVARNYVDLRGLQRRLAIARENVASQRSTLDLVRQKRSAGTVTEFDVTRASAQVSLSESQLPIFTRQIRYSLHVLSVLLAEDVDTLSEELSAPEPLPLAPADTPIGLPAELLQRRPDIRRAERALAASTAQVGAATADLYPRLTLSGTFSMEATKFAWLGNWDSHTFGFGPSIRWPIFEGGRIRANIRVQNARQEQAMALYERVVRTAVRDVEDALVTYLTEQSRRRSLSDTVDSSRQSVELAQLAYEQGTTDLLAVLDVQRTLYGAQEAWAETDQNVVTSLIALYKALGGGWDPNEESCPKPSCPD